MGSGLPSTAGSRSESVVVRAPGPPGRGKGLDRLARARARRAAQPSIISAILRASSSRVTTSTTAQIVQRLPPESLTVAER